MSFYAFSFVLKVTDDDGFFRTHPHANEKHPKTGMSYTDDGEPFDEIKIPCVMISSDVCEKLESCRPKDGRAPWTCALIPLTRYPMRHVAQWVSNVCT